MVINPANDDKSNIENPHLMKDVTIRHRHGIEVPDELFIPRPRLLENGDKNLYYCFRCAQFAPVKVAYDEIVDESPVEEGEEKMDELRMSVVEDRLCVHCDSTISRTLRPDLNCSVKVEAQDKLTKTGEHMKNAAAEFNPNRGDA